MLMMWYFFFGGPSFSLPAFFTLVRFFEQVGEDVVGELTKSLKRIGLDMRVTALVSAGFRVGL